MGVSNQEGVMDYPDIEPLDDEWFQGPKLTGEPAHPNPASDEVLPKSVSNGDLKIKTAAGKAPLGLVPLGSLAGEARVRQYGNKKYEKGNYLLAMLRDGAAERYIGGVLRHMSEVQHSLAALDSESGLPHLDHAIVGLRMLREIVTQEGLLPEDPGEGKDPPK